VRTLVLMVPYYVVILCKKNNSSRYAQKDFVLYQLSIELWNESLV